MEKEEKESVVKEAFQKWLGLFLVIIAAFAVGFVVMNAATIWNVVMDLFGVLKPVVYGCIIAYLLNPLMKVYQDLLTRLMERGKKSLSDKRRGMVRGCSITLALLSGILIIIVLCWMIIPQIVESLTSLVENLPDAVNHYYTMLNEEIRNNDLLADKFQDAALNLTKYFDEIMNKELLPWMQKELLPNVNTVAVKFANGIMGFLNVLYNLFIGIIVAIYILAGKEKFAAQAKKIAYAVFRKNHADTVIHYVRITDSMFSGFIIGKILDSTIIGLICFLCMTVLSMPYAVLISVIVGVTNIIPVFGPYLGAIPSAFLILLVSPVQALYFIILIIVLQQIDGNLIGPAILGESTGLSAFWVLFAILLFGGIWGLVGMIVGVPLFAVIYRIVGDFAAWRLREKQLREETVCYENLKSVTVGEDDSVEYIHFTRQELEQKKEEKRKKRKEIGNRFHGIVKMVSRKGQSKKSEERLDERGDDRKQ